MLSPITRSILYALGGEIDCDRTEAFRIAGAGLGYVGVLYGDYRFLPTGIVLSLLCAIFTGASNWITTLASYKSFQQNEQARCNQPFYFYYSFGLAIIGIAWKESTQDFLNAMHWRHVPLLCGSIFSAAFYMSYSKASLANIPPAFSPAITTTRYTSRSYDVLAILALSGVTGIASATGSHRSFTTPIQLGALLTTATCLCQFPRVPHICERLSDEEVKYGLSVTPPTRASLAHSIPDQLSSQIHPKDMVSLRSCRHSRPFLLAFCGSLSIIWIVFIVLNFATPPAVEDQVFLDREFSPSVPMEIVISMYKEPVNTVASLISTLRAMPGLQSPVFHI